MAVEDLDPKVVSTPTVTTVVSGEEIDDKTFQDMLAVLNELVSHTHIFYDDYSTACNCNCNCACTRGIL